MTERYITQIGGIGIKLLVDEELNDPKWHYAGNYVTPFFHEPDETLVKYFAALSPELEAIGYNLQPKVIEPKHGDTLPFWHTFYLVEEDYVNKGRRVKPKPLQSNQKVVDNKVITRHSGRLLSIYLRFKEHLESEKSETQQTDKNQ